MKWMPDPHSKDPVFQQIARHFEMLITESRLLPGEQLPSERKLAERFRVNRSTIVAAYGELRAAGLIQSVQGSGTRVSEHLWGVSPRRIPNWAQYTTGGSFHPTLPLVKRIRDAGSDPSVINLARGELSPDLFPADEIGNLLKNISLKEPLGYSNPYGSLRMRETLRLHLQTVNRIHTTPDNILITSGSQQALHLIAECLLSPGDAIALEGPSYAYSLPLFTSAGLRLYRIPMDEEGLVPDEVRTLYQKHRIRMVFVNPTYQNPTGTTLSLSRRKQLLEVCEELRIPIVEDNAYSEVRLCGSPKPPDSLMTLNRGSGLVVYLGSLSKTVAPGLRIGWAVAPPAVIRRMADAKEQMDFGMNTIVQQLAAEYLGSGWYRHLQRLTEALTDRRDAMLRALETDAYDLCIWNTPLGGYHVWCKTMGDVRDANLLELCIQNGVVVTPGGIYGAEQGYVRLTYARATKDDIEEGIGRFAQVLRTLGDRR